jgi:pyrroline-5-carboxylate reductase
VGVLGGVGTHSTHPDYRRRMTIDEGAELPVDVPLDVAIDVAVVGGGNMGAALLGGMIASGAFPAERLCVVEVLPERRSELGALFPGVQVSAEIPSCRSAVLAVKPADAAAAARVAVQAGATRVLSIAAGVRLATLDAAAEGAAVIRAMPNTPALVGKGTAAIAAGASASDDDMAWAATILGSVGTVEVLPEALIDPFTGVAGSGPAYVFLFAEALIDAAVGEGLDRATAERVVRQLMLGSAVLLDRELDPVALRRQVTSPGGTTAAGIAEFERLDLQTIVAQAVRAATQRSRELG